VRTVGRQHLTQHLGHESGPEARSVPKRRALICFGSGQAALCQTRIVRTGFMVTAQRLMAKIACIAGFLDARGTRADGARRRRSCIRDESVARHNRSLTQTTGHGRQAAA